MRAVLAVGGSLGDLHPFIALGRALRAMGIDASIATATDYRSKIEAEGLRFCEVGPSLDRLCADLGMDLAALTARIAASDGFLFERILLPYLAEATRQLIAAADGAQAIVAGTFAAGGQIAAERLGLPFVSVALQPASVFSVYDPPSLPAAPWLAPAASGPRLWMNRATAWAARRATQRWTPPLNRVRLDLGLGAVRDNLFFDAASRADLALGLYSPLLGAVQPDAPASFEVVGYAAYDSEVGGPSILPPNLAAFLEAGPPPLVFTLGSAAVNIPGRFYRESVAAARRLGMRAVLLVGPNGDLSVDEDAADLLAAAYAPYSLLFPRAAAVVHQGGVGTTQQALRAGWPQLIAPHLGDQYDNAARMARLGVAAPISRKAYRAAAVAAELGALLARPQVAAEAARLGDFARREDGASAAAARIADRLAARS